MSRKDREVTVVTRQGDKLTQVTTEKEARRLEEEPFRADSNIAWVQVNETTEGER